MTDIAVYSPATGQWRILKSTTHYATEIVSVWGSATDLPVLGDYDGDGKADPAVYRPSTGEWRILQSSTDYTTNITLSLGGGADIPVPADYDGDGVTDAAVFRAASGRWEILTVERHLQDEGSPPLWEPAMTSPFPRITTATAGPTSRSSTRAPGRFCIHARATLPV